jgi:hypothetical protein
MAVSGYTADYNYSKYTPLDNTGDQYDVFVSGYKNIRFNIQQTSQLQLDNSTAYNLPGIAYQVYGDTSLWWALLAYNGLNDPLSDVYPGLVLLIPPKAQIQAYISRQSSGSTPTLTV